jgi:hypothetical protein
LQITFSKLPMSEENRSIFKSPMPNKKMLRMLERIAELRARGVSWASTAESVRRSVKAVECWVKTYREVWDRLLHEAEGRMFREAGAEALQFLRKLLRSSSETVTRDVARTLATLLYRYPFERESGEEPMDQTTADLVKAVQSLTTNDLQEIEVAVNDQGEN